MPPTCPAPALTVKTDVTNTTTSAQTATVDRDGHPAEQRHPDHGQPERHRARQQHPDRSVHASQLPEPDHHQPAGLVAVPAGRASRCTRSDVAVAQGSTQYNSTSETFGIRTVTSYLTGSNAIEPSGARAFKINGVPIVIRGGGFDPNLFLHYSAADTAKQIALMKNMGVNAIRLEGHIMPADFFEQMDQAGHPGQRRIPVLRRVAGRRQPDHGAARASCRTRPRPSGQNLRNHPSVFSFQWSDNQPSSQQESVSIAGFPRPDFYPQTPLIASAEYKSTTTLGAGGREGGPLRLGAAELLVRHHASRIRRLDRDQRRRRLGLRQRGERRRHRADPRLAATGSCQPATCRTCGRTPRPTSTTPTTSRAARPATPSARCATSTPR